MFLPADRPARIIELINDAEFSLKKSFEGFLRHRRKSLQEANERATRAREATKEITREILAATEKDLEKTTDTISLLSHLEKIFFDITKICDNVEIKIKEGVLFSEKAVNELSELFESSINLLRHVRDAYVTRNPVLVQHILDKTQRLREAADNFATEHEDRLIRGICLPKSSVIYLLLLDSLKDIIWYQREIARCIKYEEPEKLERNIKKVG